MATVTVGVPSFGREAKNKHQWSKPVSTQFHFKLAGGKLVEVHAIGGRMMMEGKRALAAKKGAMTQGDMMQVMQSMPVK